MLELRSCLRAKALGALAAMTSAAALCASPAEAMSYTVTTLADSGSGSLRQAILDANANPGADTITFSVTEAITLTSGQLTVTGDLTIDGPGSANLAISGNDASRVLAVSAGATLALEGLRITNGTTPGSEFVGGAVANRGTLAVANCLFTANAAGGGGAIGNESGTTTVTTTTFSGNTAGFGGAISNGIETGAGTVTVTDSTFTGNTGTFNAGGIFNNEGTTLLVIASTFSGNSAPGGGALDNLGTATLTNSTFSGNSAEEGGAIRNIFRTITITNSTNFGNSATSEGGGIFNFEGSVTLANTIVANSSSGGNCTGTSAVVDGGGNLSWPDASCPGINADPVLGPLASNGGPTQTMALGAGSAAIDAAVTANCPATDQRGVTRTQGGGCDIGAYELVQTVTVGIDIKPGNFPNSINTGKKGIIPVAVLGTSTLNASTVDPSTVCFGDAEDAGQRDCTVASGTRLKDVNGDSILDLVLHFEAQQTGIDSGDTQACLTGELYDTTEIEGCDSVKTK